MFVILLYLIDNRLKAAVGSYDGTLVAVGDG